MQKDLRPTARRNREIILDQTVKGDDWAIQRVKELGRRSSWKRKEMRGGGETPVPTSQFPAKYPWKIDRQ